MSDIEFAEKLTRKIKNDIDSLFLLLTEPQPANPKQDNRPKLTKRDVKRAREMHRNGCTQRDIADCLDVHASTICRILKGVYHK